MILPAFAILLATTCGGCYTIIDASHPHLDGPHVYGGVVGHLSDFGDAPMYWWWPLWIPFTILDLPLCALADTVLLPYSLSVESRRPPRDR